MRISNTVVLRFAAAALAILGIVALCLYLVGKSWLSPQRDIVIDAGDADAGTQSEV